MNKMNNIGPMNMRKKTFFWPDGYIQVFYDLLSAVFRQSAVMLAMAS